MTDVTQHDPEQHPAPVVPKHTQAWYKMFGGKCPTCGAPAKFEVAK